MQTDTRHRTYHWDDPTPTVMASLDQGGITVLQAIRDGELPIPPAVQTLGLLPIDAQPGRVTFALEPEEFHLNPFGIVHGGVLAAMLDTAMGCAVHSLLAARVGYVTGELNVRFLRPALVTGGALTCTGEVAHEGKATAVATGRIEDTDGRLIALAGTTSLLRRP